MKNLRTVWARTNDWLNPIVVKELRQAVQGRFVLGLLILFLLVAVSVMWGFIMSVDPDSLQTDTGREAFFFFWSVLLVTCLLFIPGHAGSRLTAECANDNTDLMFITTLKPAAIIRGKMVSALILVILIYSACLPFVTLTYLLRGIDILSIFIMLGFSLAVVVCGIQVAIFLACIPVSKGLKSALNLAGLLGMLSMIPLMIEMASGMLRFGFSGMMMSGWNIWGPILTMLGFMLMGVGLLFVLSTAMITPSSANRAAPIRIYINAISLLGFVIAAAWSRSLRQHEPLVMWCIVCIGLLCLTLLAGASERDRLGPRVARTIPRRLAGRILVFLWYSGSANGICWSLVSMSLILAGLYFWLEHYPHFRLDSDFNSILVYLRAFTCYFLSYSLTAVWLRENILGRHRRIRPGLTWVVAVLLMIVLSILPLLTAFFLDVELEQSESYVWFLANPSAMLWYNRHIDMFLYASGIWAVAALAANLPWMMRQILQFQPYQRPDGPDDPPARADRRLEIG
ncbi:MAG: hypothetical protein JW810_03410 [Sedimentisphaerales bacterium]|nr:hypothetical protein [Sedimentisphaerales bacterium]